MRRCSVTLLSLVAVAAIGAELAYPPRPVLIWNASPSAPIGLYVQTRAPVAGGDLVAIAPPKPLAEFLAERGYLPVGVPLLKGIAGSSGQRVCRIGHLVTVDGLPRALALDRDRRGRPLPTWSGCRVLRAGGFFALNSAPDSLDGRYFGPLSTSSIIGVARPIWLIETRRER